MIGSIKASFFFNLFVIINKPEAVERHRRGGGGSLNGEDEVFGTRSSPREQAFSVDVGIHAV